VTALALGLPLAVLLLAGVPVAFAMGVAGMIGILLTPTLTLELIPERMHTFTDSFVFIAIPLFILSGSLMDRIGITARLIALARVLVGHIRGGLAMVTVVGEMLFSGISGSTVADVSAMSAMLLPALDRAGYQPRYAVAVISASSAMGILIPPCIPMIVLAGLGNVSVAALFVGGIIPAIVLAAMLMVLIYADAWRFGFPAEPRVRAHEFLHAVRDALIPLGMPVIIFGGIFGGVFTPTEAAAVTVLYAVLVDLLVYRALGWRDYVETFIESTAITGMVMFIVAAASVLSYLLSYMQVPEAFAALLEGSGVGPVGFLFVSAGMFLVAAVAIEPIPAMVIFVPVLFPVATALGVDLVHFGIVIIAAIGIGMFLPPIGMGLILACSVGRVPMEEAARPMLPFVLMLCLGLAVLILVPRITTVLPDLLLR
jgi:C4-dicarboxylate transporter, DctM subunit